MTDTNYARLIEDGLKKLRSLLYQRNRTNSDILKTKQYIRATANMLPLEERKRFDKQLEMIAGQTGGLTEAVKDVLFSGTLGTIDRYMTAAEVRDSLVTAGFDFSHYRSNPLASVSTVLTRLKPSEVDQKPIDGVAAYRAKDVGSWTVSNVANLPEGRGSRLIAQASNANMRKN